MSLKTPISATSASDPDLHAAALMVARFRDSLDATLGLPEWQEGIRAAVEELELPAQRQGVSWVQSILSLPLESKREVFNWLLANPAGRLKSSSARSLAQAWGVVGLTFTRASLSSTRWNDLRRKLAIRHASYYRAYKNAQSFLYSKFEYIPRQATRELRQSRDRREDCIQEGSLGLLQAIDRIKPGRPFASYAFQWTRRRIRNFLMTSDLPVSAPVNLVSRVSRSDSEESELDCKSRSLAQAIACLQQPRIEFTDEVANERVMADASDESETSPLGHAIRRDIESAVEFALSQLTEKQREVLALRFGVLDQAACQTLQEIARVAGISRQQVSRREQRALSQLERLFSPLRHELA